MVDIKEHATHRAPTNIHFGKGYFGDGWKYYKFASDAEALHEIGLRLRTDFLGIQKLSHHEWIDIN